ncbi:hypothetical protein Tter_0545 [Thermobaculum terrenum ATCC BAA-798]|uniref:Uncharacterized protein n=2 Tax=Thermobaculum TaxID=262406 RepID=D1CEV7_THET1|nr:hypothetical protein Tter_0545 [Thermobaculum terrenum ATCC BAA-798]
MRRAATVVGIVGAIALWAGFLVVCNRLGPAGVEPTSYYEGDVYAVSTSQAGPLRLLLWRVSYQPQQPLGRAIALTYTVVYLCLTNTGSSPVILYETREGSKGEPPPPPPYYLLDDQGHRYPAVGAGWSWRTGEPEERFIGKALPGRTVDFTLDFNPIPTHVRHLVLVMEDVRTQTGQSYDLRVEVPLPGEHEGQEGSTLVGCPGF